ncbi:hypothetical protein Tco_0340349 [Tanacetum coccineum]
MLKKFGLEDSKPIKTPMSSETKLTQDEDRESVDNTKYRGMIGSLFYLTANRPHIMFSVCLCARFQEDPKTSHLEAFSKKQTALAISITEAEYVSAEKACQQALWMKQALVDYDIKLDDILMSIRKAFGGNTRDLGSFREEMVKTTDLHQNLLKIMLTKRGDSVTSIKRRRHDLRSDGVSTLVTPLEHGRPKGTLEDSVSRD